MATASSGDHKPNPTLARRSNRRAKLMTDALLRFGRAIIDSYNGDVDVIRREKEAGKLAMPEDEYINSRSSG